jgi:hypothetical protein
MEGRAKGVPSKFGWNRERNSGEMQANLVPSKFGWDWVFKVSSNFNHL